jgi:hypothetical protein
MQLIASSSLTSSPDAYIDVIEWRPVVGWEGLYEVSSGGQVRSVDRIITTASGDRRYRGQLLKRAAHPVRGYLSVTLAYGVRRNVHVLVAEAFRGARPDGKQVAHWDGDPTNNVTFNLRFASPGENQLDAVRHGTHYRASRVTCPLGHPLATWNCTAASLRRGNRDCLACNRGGSFWRRNEHLDRRSICDSYYAELERKHRASRVQVIDPVDPDLIRPQAAPTEADYVEEMLRSIERDFREDDDEVA